MDCKWVNNNMMANFKKNFNPTEKDKEELVITYLQILAQLVRDKDCCTCKHSETRKAYIHNYETAECYCTLRKCVGLKTCNNYEVRNVQDL